MDRSDRYARLRDNLRVHRTMTQQRSSVLWCRGCETHLADESGLCPLCLPEDDAAA